MDLLEKIISLCKRRGFVFMGSDIYGGLANTYDFGPLGVLLKRNLMNYWWQNFVSDRTDMFGLDTCNLMSPKVWEASGHTSGFTNILIDCTNCQYRTRADHLIEDFLPNIGNVEGRPLFELDELIQTNKIPCPKCHKTAWTKSRNFNQLFETKIGIITSEKNTAYLRGELAQGMFVNFKNVIDSMHPRLPFGLAQSGKAYRNEITMGKFTFRTLEFDLAEFEYFVQPDLWQESFEYWKSQMSVFAEKIGLDSQKLRWRSHSPQELSHYSKRTEDLEYQFPWGFKEMWGLAYRTDFDLKNHMEQSKVNLKYVDSQTGANFIPHVIEPTFGLSRLFTILLMDAYREEGDRVYLRLSPKLAPYKVAVFPLLKNRPELIDKATQLFGHLKSELSNVIWDDRGNIGKRYYAQDEIGTPWCVTVDFQTLEDNTVTIRDRDTATQARMPIAELDTYFHNQLK